MITDDLLRRVELLANHHLALNRSAVELKHWTFDRHYPGRECLSFSERSFGRALRLWESLLRLNGEDTRVGLHEQETSPGTWDCYTPNSDRSESHHRILTDPHEPWQVFKVEHLAGNTEVLKPSPFSVWANLDAPGRWEPDGRAANLTAWNADRILANQAPYTVAIHADDKHALLLMLMLGTRFRCFRERDGVTIHASTLKNFAYGYQSEMADWMPAGAWHAMQAGADPADDFNPGPYQAGTAASASAPAADGSGMF